MAEEEASQIAEAIPVLSEREWLESDRDLARSNAAHAFTQARIHILGAAWFGLLAVIVALPGKHIGIGLLFASLPRAQHGSVSERPAEVCCLSPSPRHDWCVSRPAACERPAGGTASRSARSWEGVRWRGGRRARPGRVHQREGSWGARGGRTWSVEKAV